jgi:hypothetical protein
MKMKRQILVSLSLLGSVLITNAQIYGTILGPSGNNNVGIGVSAPTSKLEIKSSVGSEAIRILDDGLTPRFTIGQIAGYQGNLIDSKSIDLHFQSYYTAGTGGNIIFKTGDISTSSEKMRVDRDGNLGIGVVNPTSKLDIKSPVGLEVIRILDQGLTPRFSIGQIANYQGNIIDSKNIDLLFQSYYNVGTGGNIIFKTGDINTSSEKMRIDKNGNIGIGTINPDAKLAVKGTIHSEEVKVDLNVPAPDYVFEKNYILRPLAEVETYINQNKHLPEVPAAKEMEANGVNLGEMNMLLLKKVEELTLYMLEQDKINNQQAKQIEWLKKKLSAVENR